MVPSLQNPYMLAHPPLLYLGYVGLTVPFAFAMGALLSGRTDERWIVATRRWTLAAWTFLGVGQLIGAHWAYVEIGWGGYYAWDPVENAALMPWLAATAFLHSVMIQEKRGMLKVWNMVLVALAFNLSLFGTFLTRSGVINSIHSFSQSSIGGWFLAFLGSDDRPLDRAHLRWRLPLLRTKTKLESLVSREATFLYNNLLLVALCLTILWGVLYPILSEAVRGETRSVSKPYYDFFLHTFGLPLLLLMGHRAARGVAEGVAALARQDVRHPVHGGRRDRRRAARARLRELVAGPARVHVLGLRRRIDRARVRARAARPQAASSGSIARNRRRYGGYIVHAAIVLLAIGIAGSSAYQTAARAGPAAGAVDRGRRLHAHLHRARRREGAELHRLPGAPRGLRPRRALPPRPGDEQLRDRGACRTRRRSTTIRARSATSSRPRSSPGSTRTRST